MTVIPVLATAIDWRALNSATQEALGYPLSRELDVRKIPANNPRGLRMLFATDQASDLCMLGFFCSGVIPWEYLRDSGRISHVTLDESRNSWTGILFGTYDEWVKITGSTDPKIRELAAKVAQYMRQM